MKKKKVAIIGSGNIGTDLMIKVMRNGGVIEMGVLVGIDANSDGLARATRMGVKTTDRGIDGLVDMPEFSDIEIVFDATSAGAHQRHAEILAKHGKQVIDLTPAAIGPYTVPVVNMKNNLDTPNLNMVTCGGQATIPIVSAVNSVSPVIYAEIVASISSRSAGPGTRANIDEFTETTARAIETIGGALKGKAIIVLNPAEPPLLMRDTVYCLSEGGDRGRIATAVSEMVEKVANYVPGYRLKHDVQFEDIGRNRAVNIPGIGPASGLKTTVLLEVEGAAHYLPAFAGNLDIMTSAALVTAQNIAEMKGRAARA